MAKAKSPSMVYRYERAYNQLLSKLSEPLQERVLAVKLNPDTSDKYVDDFIQQVIALAESDKEV